MKKSGLILLVLFLCGCQNPYYTKLNEHKIKMRQWQIRFDEHKDKTDRLNEQEGFFIQTLTDEELVCYELAVQAFKSRIQTSQELARRNLQATMSEDKYQSAMELLNTRVQICKETSALGSQINTLKNEAESLARWRERQLQATSDYMLRESIRNRNTQW